MTDITRPERKPRDQGEREIAIAMHAAAKTFDRLQEENLTLIPPTAVSVGFINYGIQLGCLYTDIPTVAAYLRGCAAEIEKMGN